MRCSAIMTYDKCYTPTVWDFPNITRPFSIIYYVLGGTAYYKIDNVEHIFEKDHLYILPANRVFSLREDPNDKFYSVYVHAFTSPEINTVVDIDTQNDYFIREILELISKYSKDEDSVYMHHLIDMVLSYIFETYKKAETSLPTRLKNYIDIEYINVFHQNNHLTKFNYSSQYLSRIFKEKYNVTPKDYAKQLILKEAVLMLYKGISVHETAKRLGFSFPENFCRFFKGHYGYSPSKYIKQFKNFPV